MYFWEEIVAFAIALALGILFIARPTTVYLYLQNVFGGADTGRRGPWGGDPELSNRSRLIIRLVGIGLLVIALVIASVPLWRDAAGM